MSVERDEQVRQMHRANEEEEAYRRDVAFLLLLDDTPSTRAARAVMPPAMLAPSSEDLTRSD